MQLPNANVVSRYQRHIVLAVGVLMTLLLLHSYGYGPSGTISHLNTDSKPAPLAPTKPTHPSTKGLTLLDPIFAAEYPDETQIALCLAIKDQARDLKEFFVHHYHHLGIRRFYIMDDVSDPPLSSPQYDYGIPRSAITFHTYTAEGRTESMQNTIYNDCIAWYGTRHRWIAFMDGDEYYEMTGGERIQDLLAELDARDDVGALAVNWLTHNSNGQLTRQPSVRKAYTSCIWDKEHEDGALNSDNKHVKSIVKPYFYESPRSPHSFNLKHNAHAVGEHGDPVEAHLRKVSRDRIALHHYAVKSREEYQQKIDRSNAMDTPKGWDWWDHIEQLPTQDCPSMARYNP